MELYEYNPALLAPNVLKEILTGRDSELQDIESALENASKGGSFAHTLFIGPRGIGKTHVLQIINLGIKGEIDVKGISEYKDYYIPVIFAEEEYASDFTQFTKLILRYLPEQYRFGTLDKITSARIVTAKEKESAMAFLETFKKKTGKILLLLIDNLNDILESFTDEDKSILRNILMTSNSVLLIGAAPSFFDSIINHEEPLYNFFMARKISDLGFDDTKALLNKCAHLSDRDDLTETITKSEAKLKAILRLAGGNPRLIMNLYHIIADGDVASVEVMFLKILNQLTPYFRERMKDLSEQQRKIVDVMTRERDLLTPTEMAHICQLPVNTVNTQIKRLEEIGFVRKASKIKGGKVLYDINERLFSLWRQMRIEAGRTRLEFIVRFLEIWYSPEELMNRLDKTNVKVSQLSSFSELLSVQKCSFLSNSLIYTVEGVNDNIGVAMKNLNEMINLLMKMRDIDDEVYDILLAAINAMFPYKKIELIKLTLNELEKVNNKKLKELLHPYTTVIEYLKSNKDPDVIERLRFEERIIVDEILKVIPDA